MIEVNVHDAESHLAEFVEKALEGEEVVIDQDAAHAVRLVPVAVKAENAPEFSNELLASIDDCELNHYLG